MDEYIGRRICQARKAKHITQETLAELSGLSVSAISRIETGRSSTSLKTLKRLSNILGVTLDYLLYDILPEQSPSQNPTISDIVTVLERLDESQQELILELIQVYARHLFTD